MSHLPSEAVHILLFHPQLDGIVGWNNGVPKGGGGSRNLRDLRASRSRLSFVACSLMTASTSIVSSSSVTESHYKRVYSRGQSLVRSFTSVAPVSSLAPFASRLSSCNLKPEPPYSCSHTSFSALFCRATITPQSLLWLTPDGAQTHTACATLDTAIPFANALFAGRSVKRGF